MSYAGRLVAMSRGVVPLVAPHTAHEIVREVQVETAARPAMRTSPVTTAAHREPTRSSSSVAATTEVTPARERTEHTIVERVREVAAPSQPASPPPSVTRAGEPVTEVERIVLPATPAPWLAEDSSAPDPLVASADTDALRELMRSVRQWTASPPTMIETSPPPAQAPVAPAPLSPEPVQVSIGNVVVTVEDSPAASPRGRSPSPARSLGDRLARNHIRGT